MNVQKAWNMGYTGKGVAVTILDDGIEKEHPDLANNYVSIKCRIDDGGDDDNDDDDDDDDDLWPVMIISLTYVYKLELALLGIKSCKKCTFLELL